MRNEKRTFGITKYYWTRLKFIARDTKNILLSFNSNKHAKINNKLEDM